jgi:hypothetical protein
MITTSSTFFELAKFRQKTRLIFFEEKTDFEGFQSLKVRKKRVKITKFAYLGCRFIAKNTKGGRFFNTLFLVYSQIWLKLPRDAHHFLWIRATLATKQCFFYWRIFAKNLT